VNRGFRGGQEGAERRKTPSLCSPLRPHTLLACALLLTRVGAAEELGTAARAEREAAESALAETRATIVDERRALLARIAELQDGLDAARDELDERRATTADLEEKATARRTTEREAADDHRRAMAGLPLHLGATADRDDPLPALTAAIDRRLADLEDAARVRRVEATVHGRDGRARTVPVLRLGAAAAFACGEEPAACGHLVPGPGGPTVAPRPATARESALIRAADPAAERLALPFAFGGAERRAPVGAQGFVAWFRSGGDLMWAIAACGALGLLLLLERIAFFSRHRPPRSGGPAKGHGPHARLAAAADAVAGGPRERLEAALEGALVEGNERYRRGLGGLATLSAIAPLLGLLGTITGMVAIFAGLAEHGSGDPQMLSEGISLALVTTQFGLMVAVPLILAHAWLRRCANARAAALERAALDLCGRPDRGGDA